eukprot:1013479-Amphidinium_carterae.2
MVGVRTTALSLLLMLLWEAFGMKFVPILSLKLAICGEAAEDLEHIVHHCPAWAAERREVALPASALEVPPCVKLHGLLPAPKRQVVLRHSSNPHFRSLEGVELAQSGGQDALEEDHEITQLVQEAA